MKCVQATIRRSPSISAAFVCWLTAAICGMPNFLPPAAFGQGNGKPASPPRLLAGRQTGGPDALRQEPIKIGIIASQTGFASPQGIDMLHGFQLFMEENGAKISGRPVKMIVEDDQSDPKVAKRKLTKLLKEDKVDLIAGINSSEAAYVCAPLSEQYQVPLVDAVASSDALTQRRHNRWLVRTGNSSSQSSHAFGEYAHNKLGYDKVITFGMDTPFAWEMIAGFQRTFEQAGGTIVQKIWVPRSGLDYSSYLKNLNSDADAIYFVTAGIPARLIARQFRAMHPKLPILAGPVSYNETVLQREGNDALGAISATVYSSSIDNPENKIFVQKFQTKYGRLPSSTSEFGYTSAMWIARALLAVHGQVADRTKLLAALKSSIWLNAPRGKIKLDNWGNPVESVYVVKVQSDHGRLGTTILDTFPEISQFWRYDASTYLKGAPYSKTYPPCKHCR